MEKDNFKRIVIKALNKSGDFAFIEEKTYEYIIFNVIEKLEKGNGKPSTLYIMPFKPTRTKKSIRILAHSLDRYALELYRNGRISKILRVCTEFVGIERSILFVYGSA